MTVISNVSGHAYRSLPRIISLVVHPDNSYLYHASESLQVGIINGHPLIDRSQTDIFIETVPALSRRKPKRAEAIETAHRPVDFRTH